MARKRRDHIAFTRGMAGAAVKGRSAARRCVKCGMAIIRYPGRYPSTCPTCGGEIEMVESVISCTSQVPRLQQVIDGGVRAGRPCVFSSNSFIVPYEQVSRAIPEGVHGLTAFLEGPAQGRYYRVESPGDPVIILELDDTLERARLFATENPASYLGGDPRREFIDTLEALDSPVSGNTPSHAGPWERKVRKMIGGALVDTRWAGPLTNRPEIAFSAGINSHTEVARFGYGATREEAFQDLYGLLTKGRPAGPGRPALPPLYPGGRKAAPAAPARAKPAASSAGDPQNTLLQRLNQGRAFSAELVRPGEFVVTSDVYGPKDMVKFLRRRVRDVGGTGTGARMRYAGKRVRIQMDGRVATLLLERGGPFGAPNAEPPSWDHENQAAMQDEAKKRGRHKPGDRQTTPYDGFRFSVGHNKSRKPRKDMMRAMQNRRNARRGLAKRTKASQDWHRSPDGMRLHKALGRYNRHSDKRRNEAAQGVLSEVLLEALSAWRPYETLFEAAADYLETIDDVLDGVLRKLLVIEALDVLQDVEFDDVSGSIYLFFSPMLEAHEVDYMAKLLQGSFNGLQVIASPDGSLPNEQAPADWWVLYIPRSKNEGMQPPAPDPRFYSTDYPDGPPSSSDEEPPVQLKQQMVVQAPMSSAEQIAQTIDIDQALDAIGAQESLSTLPASLAEKVARKFGALAAQRSPR